jgi:hypothetical protein
MKFKIKVTLFLSDSLEGPLDSQTSLYSSHLLKIFLVVYSVGLLNYMLYDFFSSSTGIFWEILIIGNEKLCYLRCWILTTLHYFIIIKIDTCFCFYYIFFLKKFFSLLILSSHCINSFNEFLFIIPINLFIYFASEISSWPYKSFDEILWKI